MSQSSRTIDLRILPYQKERDTYEMRARCTNCGWIGRVLVPKGEEAPGRSPRRIFGSNYATCETCGCETVTTTGDF